MPNNIDPPLQQGPSLHLIPKTPSPRTRARAQPKRPRTSVHQDNSPNIQPNAPSLSPHAQAPPKCPRTSTNQDAGPITQPVTPPLPLTPLQPATASITSPQAQIPSQPPKTPLSQLHQTTTKSILEYKGLLQQLATFRNNHLYQGR